ncbi:MAG: cell wall hydrolase [Xanthomonadales bacterium]|nr:cell wall hydrolase [Xanthomonadales bacterium]
MQLATLLMIASWLPQPLADQTCLTAALYLEARDQPILGQVAVAEVALRRQRASRHHDNLCQVLLQPRQFALTLVSPNYRFRNLAAWNRASRISAATMARWSQDGDRLSVVPTADHFFAVAYGEPSWAAHGVRIAQIGDHAFYRLSP